MKPRRFKVAFGSALLALIWAVSGIVTFGWVDPAAAASAPPWEPDPSSVGGLLFFNAAGQQITGGNLSDSPISAYVEGTSVVRSGDTVATLYGYLPINGQQPSAWSGDQLGASTSYPNASAPPPLDTAALPLETGASGDVSIVGLDTAFPNNDTSNDGYAGIYELRLYTNAARQTQTTSYDSADIQITGSTWSVVYPAPTVTSTTTTLTTTPGSPQTAGTSVQLTATIIPAASGTVQFKVGNTNIGGAVIVSGGTASIATTTLPVGTDALSAVFSPAPFSAYDGSTGTSSFTVQPAPAAATTTALSVNPSTAAADTGVTLTAALTNTSTSAALNPGDGQVAFYDDGTSSSGGVTTSSIPLGSVALGTGGIASLTYSSFAEGLHYIVAVFTPADSSVYNSSTSLPLPFTATAPQFAPADQDVTAAIPAGTLTITTPYSPTSPFSLGTATLSNAGTEFSASAPFGSSVNPSQGVTITDTRAGDQAWNASATVTDFSDGPNVINGQNLTFTGVTPSYIGGNALQSGSVMTTDVTGAKIYGPTDPGTDGLKGGPHQFASAQNGDGTVYIDGLLSLTAPTSTPVGTYTATLTFTVI